MRDMLEPIFGDTGAFIAQFVITLIVVLLLIVVVVWLVRRYSHGGFGTTTRGRLPRLAIVDAMVVDNRRRLVLIRRDNVEHLLLIGGPSDIVVEPSIIRTRSAAARGAQNGQAAPPGRTTPVAEPVLPARPPVPPSMAAPPAPEAPPPRRAEAVGADEPIPFPPRRAPAGARAALRHEPPKPPERQAAPVPADEFRQPRQPPAVAPPDPADAVEFGIAEDARQPAARFAETARPTRITPGFTDIAGPESLPEAVEAVVEAPAVETPEPAAAQADGEDEASIAFLLPPEDDIAGEPAAAAPAAAEDRPADRPADQRDTAAKVGELEKEMARLLGEISGRRTS